jgi:hypothetical protein
MDISPWIVAVTFNTKPSVLINVCTTIEQAGVASEPLQCILIEIA